MAKITIENLRHIRKLEFDIPGRGVWLLTGANGTGKTSLLACLRRLGFKNAFPTHFPASRLSTQVDSYEGASIKYETPGGEVTYTYTTTRWSPRPKVNSDVLRTVGFPEVIYIAANAARIEPSQEDFSPRKVRSAPVPLVQAANQIFCTTKFNALKTINLRKGVGSQAFLLELEAAGRQRRQYFSEKNLSLGELCILKLLRMLKDCPIGTLVLIDELELALHPTAQTELLKYLEHIAGEKSLTVIVSTHSATIIKQASRRQILLLEANDQGEVICTSNCFPSYVLGTLADREESASDVVVYVEDEAAQAIVSQLVKRFTAEQFAVHSLLPSVSVVPVGGFANVLRFFVHQRPLLPAVTRAYVVLDADAEPSLANAQVPEIIRIYRNERRAISFLPFTPEVGLVAFLHAERARLLQDLRVHYSNNTLSLRQNDLDPIPPDGQGQRAACKRIVDAVCTHLVGQLPNTEAAEVRQTLFKLLAEHTFATQRPAIMQQFGPIIRG